MNSRLAVVHAVRSSHNRPIMHTIFRSERDLPALLGALGITAAGGFATLAWKTARRETSFVDGRARARTPRPRRKRAKKTAIAVGLLGKGWIAASIGLTVAAGMARRRAHGAAASIATASVASYALSTAFDHMLPHREPPPGRRSPSTPSFPSGHAMHATAVANTIAYVLTREGIVDWRLAAALGGVAGPGMGFGRLYLDRHWLTDVAAGWLAGISIAAFCSAAYEGAAAS